MQIKKPSIFLIIALLSIPVNSQNLGTTAPSIGSVENDPFSNFQKKTPMMQELFQKIRNPQNEITYDLGPSVGSPFENKEYQPGKVFYGNEFLGDYYYRYNAYNQEIELKRTLLPEEKMQALIQDLKVTLQASGNRYMYRSMLMENGNREDGYLKLFHEGDNYELYERYIVKFKANLPKIQWLHLFQAGLQITLNIIFKILKKIL